MKKLIGFLALAGLIGGAIITLRDTTEAMAPTPSPIVRVECIGTAGTGSTGCCNEPGPRQFAYRVVIPGGDIPISVSQLDIGTHWPDPAAYGNLLMPTGWTMNILPAPYVSPDRFACTSHGNLTFIGGDCPYILRWSGPPQTSSFVVGFDANGPFTFDIHDVNWQISPTKKANWNQPVGRGRGPVHCIAFP